MHNDNLYAHNDVDIESMDIFKNVLELFQLPPLFKKHNFVKKIGFLYSKGNVQTQPHIDPTGGVLLHLYGIGVTKVVFSYPVLGNNVLPKKSEVADLSQPGDCIFIPANVTHTAKSKGERIAIT
eukprot:scaffold462909_cov185-Attheya_sp.AAC.1